MAGAVKVAECCVLTEKSQDVLSVPLVFLTQSADESGPCYLTGITSQDRQVL